MPSEIKQLTETIRTQALIAYMLHVCIACVFALVLPGYRNRTCTHERNINHIISDMIPSVCLRTHMRVRSMHTHMRAHTQTQVRVSDLQARHRRNTERGISISISISISVSISICT